MSPRRRWEFVFIAAVIAVVGGLAAMACAAKEPGAPQQPAEPAPGATVAAAAPGAPQQPQQPAPAPTPVPVVATPEPITGQVVLEANIPAKEAEPPMPGGTLRITGRDRKHFNNAKGGGEIYTSSVTHDTLTYWYRDDITVTKDYRPLPELAESWGYPTDTSVVFRLRKGVKFQDVAPVFGREVVADDVVFSFNRLLDPAFPYIASLGPITGINALDDYTVEFTFSEPFAPFMTPLGMPYYRVDAPEVEEEFGTFDPFESLIGTGQYIANRYERGVVMVLDKNPDYFRGPNGITGEQLPYIDQIRVVVATDDAAKMAMYRAGQLDAGPIYQHWGFWTTNPEAMQALKDRPDLTWTYVVTPGAVATTNMMAGRQDMRPWSNLKLRQAIALVWDISCEAYCFVTGAQTNARFLSDEHPWFVPTEGLTPEGQKFFKKFPASTIDVPEAQRLLAAGLAELKAEALAAGATDEAALYEPGKFKTTMWTNNSDNSMVQLAEKYAGDFRKQLGMEVDVVVLTVAEYADKIQVNKDYNGLVFEYRGSGVLDPNDMFYGYFACGAPANWYGTCDPVLDEMTLAARRELDPVKRGELYREIQIHMAPLMYAWTTPTWADANIFPVWVKNPGPQLLSNPGDMWLQAWLSADAPGRKK